METGMLESVEKHGAVDYLALVKGDLVTEFAVSGLSKRFLRIRTGLDESWGTSGKSLSVMIDEKGSATFEVVVELQDAEYSRSQLKRIAIDTFATQAAADAAAQKIKKLFGLFADAPAAPQKQDPLAELPDFGSIVRRRSRFAEFVSDVVIPGGVCAVVTIIVGAALFAVASVAKAMKDGVHVTIITDGAKQGQLENSVWVSRVGMTEPLQFISSAGGKEKVLEVLPAAGKPDGEDGFPTKPIFDGAR